MDFCTQARIEAFVLCRAAVTKLYGPQRASRSSPARPNGPSGSPYGALPGLVRKVRDTRIRVQDVAGRLGGWKL
ncbi:hypothetical protein ABT404_10900 [Streptomyces hyaluromycini]|uniref:Transposase n=1 Tax=Streptomyces hyaluromycini TaxID=1377993 RepID=A0ABV1WTD5_9ACTN